MATYYRVNLKDKQGNIIYPRIDPNITINKTGEMTFRQKTYFTQTGSKPVIYQRAASTAEQVAHYVFDSYYNIQYTNDEATSQIRFDLINTDTEDSDGTNANTSYVRFYGRASGSLIHSTQVTATSFYAFTEAQTFTNGAYFINAKNSDIINLNALYFSNDLNDSGREGIRFIRSNSNYDTLTVVDGEGRLYTNKTLEDMPTSYYRLITSQGGTFDGLIYLDGVGSSSSASKSGIIFGNENTTYISIKANTNKRLLISDGTTANAITYSATSLYPQSSETMSLGQTSYRFGAVYGTVGNFNAGIKVTPGSSALNETGIVFSGDKSRIGANDSGAIGIYGTNSIYLRPGLDGEFSTNNGLVVTGTSVYPGNNNATTLGTSSNTWSKVYGGCTSVENNLTNPTTGTWYSVTWINSLTNGENSKIRTNNGARIYHLEGTTSALGRVILMLGNTTASGNANNKYGELRLCGQNTTYYTTVQAHPSVGRNATVQLPVYNGRIVETRDDTARYLYAGTISSWTNNYADFANGSIMFCW